MNGWIRAAVLAAVTAAVTVAAYAIAERFRPAIEAAADDAEHAARAHLSALNERRRIDSIVARERPWLLWEAWQIVESATTEGAGE